MFVVNLLTSYIARLTRRYLTFEKHSPGSPPKPKKDGSYLLYMHIPFCEELCPYCSFVRVKFEHSLASRYFDALKKEIEIYHELGYSFDSIYIGGGTPTIMPDRLARIIEFVTSTWQIKQISVETNPNHLRPEILRILKDVGTNRLSIGVQSLNNEILENIRRLEKYGSGEEIKQVLSSVVGMFDTVNIDMIFNFPNQTEEMLAADIKIIKEIKPDQITYYPLIVSNSKKKEIAKTCGKINYEKEKRLYQLLVEQLTDIYNQESIWCFSNKKGSIDEYIMDNDEYVGVGPGSWGYINGTMYSNTFSIRQYISMIQENKSPVIANRSFSYLERIRYCFLLKLLGGTVSVSDMKEKYGNGSWLYLCRELLLLFTTRSVTFKDNNIILTPRGRYYCLVLMRTLFSVVGDYREIRASLDAVSSA
jgi:coproporphyrinogen III oxidase-like Fe-S oxidoreductase